MVKEETSFGDLQSNMETVGVGVDVGDEEGEEEDVDGENEDGSDEEGVEEEDHCHNQTKMPSVTMLKAADADVADVATVGDAAGRRHDPSSACGAGGVGASSAGADRSHRKRRSCVVGNRLGTRRDKRMKEKEGRARRLRILLLLLLLLSSSRWPR